VIPLRGFDPDGDPEVRRMADGSMRLMFNFMPPSWAEDNPKRFDDFDRQLAAVTGVPVEWEDREVFRINRPAADTIERIRQFLRSYPRQP
jgi:hypothetical protein